MFPRTTPTSLISLLCAGSLLAGCAVGPDYVRPQIDTPAAYKNEGQWKTAQPVDEQPRGAWWSVFADPQLDELMTRLNQSNFTIAQYEAQYRQAAALLRQAEAGNSPTVTAGLTDTRAVSSPGAKPATTHYVNAAASWELDLWGNVRRSIESNQAALAVSAANVEAIRLSMQAQLATAYLQLVVTDQQLRQLKESEKTLGDTLQITRNQYAAGIISESSVALAESQYKTAHASLLAKQLTRKQLEDAIAVVTGTMPSEFVIAETQLAPHLPRIPAGIPSTLLERRPDIAAAERTVAEANAKIGVAQATRFPSLTLSASGGYKSSSFSDWISLPNRIWSLGPQLAATLFDGGLRKAQTEQAIASYDASVASYRQTVLTAFQGVEDNLAAQQGYAEQAQYQQEALNAAKRAEEIALNQYRAGTVAYINVLSAQTTRISAESSLWTIRASQYSSAVSLISALGGGW